MGEGREEEKLDNLFGIKGPVKINEKSHERRLVLRYICECVSAWEGAGGGGVGRISAAIKTGTFGV